MGGRGQDGMVVVATTVQLRTANVAGEVDEAVGACPDRTFALGTLTVTVSETTSYVHGACESLVDAVKVEIKGTTDANGVVVASRVEFEKPARPEPTPDPDPLPDPDPVPVPDPLPPPPTPVPPVPPAPPTPPGKPLKVEGAASAVAGTCPAPTFTVAGKSVRTNAATNFTGSGSCALIVNGKAVEVTGDEAEGIVTATRVKVSK